MRPARQRNAIRVFGLSIVRSGIQCRRGGRFAAFVAGTRTLSGENVTRDDSTSSANCTTASRSAVLPGRIDVVKLAQAYETGLKAAPQCLAS